MKLLVILSSLVIIQAAVVPEEEAKCNGVTINNVYHEKEILISDIDRPYMLAVDYGTNILYFSYNVIEDPEIFKTARINLNNKQFANIEAVSNGFVQTVDQKSHDVYIGGINGLYKYNDNTNKFEFVGENGTDIWMVYFKDVLYYNTISSQFLNTFIDGHSTRYRDLEDTKVDKFVIDNEDDMFFTNTTGLYRQKKGTKDAVQYQNFSPDGSRCLTTDTNGNVYVCMKDGFYAVKKESTSVEKIMDMDDPFGMAFDKDNNIVYSNANYLVRLKPNREKSC